MPRFLRILLTGSSFLVYSLTGAVFGYLVLPIAMLGAKSERERRRRAHDWMQSCSRFFVGYMRLVGLLGLKTAELPEHLSERGKAVIIVNHPSLLDVIMVLTAIPGLTFLAKRPWFRSLFIGRMLRYGGHIPGPPTDQPSPMDGALVFDRIVSRLDDGYPVLVFPEGSRSPPGELRPFQRGAFEAAMRAKVPLIALLLRVEPPNLLRGQPWYRVPDQAMRYDLSLMSIVEPEQFPRSARAFARQMRARYAEALGHEAVARSNEAPEAVRSTESATA